MLYQELVHPLMMMMRLIQRELPACEGGDESKIQLSSGVRRRRWTNEVCMEGGTTPVKAWGSISSNVKNAAILNEIESSSDLQIADGWKGVDRSETDNCGGDNQFVDGNDCVALVEKDISGPAVVACVSQSPGSIVDGYSGP